MTIDSDILIGLSEGELQALADCKLAPSEQGRLDDLLQRNNEQQLTAAEAAELDALLARVDHLTVLKARARYTLQKQEVATEA